MGPRYFAIIFCWLGCVCPLWAQGSPKPADKPTSTAPRTPNDRSQDDRRPASASPRKFLINVVHDQKDIWTSPFKLRSQDLRWVVPFAGVTAGLVNADAELSSRIKGTSSLSQHSGTISNAGLGAAIAGPAGLFLLGKINGNEHLQETGILSEEAAANAWVVFSGLKLVTQRARPNDGNAQGKFWNSQSITNSSFPSGHATMVWSVASVFAHEYPGPLSQIFAYGLATTVSAARVSHRDHFPSDVVVGSALGWLVGRHIYSAHHDPDLPGAGYGRFHVGEVEPGVVPAHRASPYVPIDSWVYSAMDRLIALGVVQTGIVGMRPWTQSEFVRLLEEASVEIDPGSGDEPSRLYAALEQEFSSEFNGDLRGYASVDSLYTRVTGISGTPLTDGYHFGQTIVNDYGRPYQKGANAVAGFSASAVSGIIGVYVRGEYEHAPSAAGFSQTVQDAIQQADLKPAMPASSVAAFDKPRLLDTYIMMNLGGTQLSFGKQTLWLGPTQDPFLWSNNAEPIYMFRVDQTTPQKLPSFLGLLGPVRSEFWLGKLTGQHFVETQDVAVGLVERLGRSLDKQPMVNGVKFSFKPTPNFEFGVARTGLFGGPDFPITAATLKHSLFSTGNSVGRGNDPGDRRSTVDFSYKVPGLRKWLTLYDDSFVEDEISPIGYPRRAAHNPGIYLTQLPGAPHVDFRAEASFTNLPGLFQLPTGGFFYWNTRYLDGYTNKGNILGNATVGRQGIAYRAESKYWFASDRTVGVGYRNEVADNQFLQGGNLRDVYLKSEWAFSKRVSLSSFLQYEWWNFPLLSAGTKQKDFTASFQLTYRPHWMFKRQN